MRGLDNQQKLFSYISPKSRVSQNYPLQPVRAMANKALKELSPVFKEMYSNTGRRSIAPEKPLRSLLIQILYSIRSQRMLVEQLDYNLLFRWFVGLFMDESIWDHSTYSKNRDRLLSADVAVLFLNQVTKAADNAGLFSAENLIIDGTLIEARASMKSFRPKGDDFSGDGDGTRNPEIDFHGTRRCNDTHESTTDPGARLYKKSKGAAAKLSFLGHALKENRNGLVVDTRVTKSTGTAEREAAISMVKDIPRRNRITLGAANGYDTKNFVEQLRDLNVTPHVTQKKHSAIDGRTTRHVGYRTNQKIRKRVEEIFGWAKTVGDIRKSRFRDKNKVDWLLTFTAAAFNLTRMQNLGVSASG